jgi:hypothetical protein
MRPIGEIHRRRALGSNHSREDDPDEGYKTSMIYSFEKIPNHDPKNRTVLPTPLDVRKHGIKTEIITIKNCKVANDGNAFPEEIVSDAAQVIVGAWVSVGVASVGPTIPLAG